jgi:hypothetical protein
MLIELWEGLRGYDKWVQTEATVESSRTKSVPTRHGKLRESDDVLLWTDGGGERHRAFFEINETSPLYQLIQDSKITIRYNPADPEQYYLRELVSNQVLAPTGKALGVVVLLAFVAILIYAILER